MRFGGGRRRSSCVGTLLGVPPAEVLDRRRDLSGWVLTPWWRGLRGARIVLAVVACGVQVAAPVRMDGLG